MCSGIQILVKWMDDTYPDLIDIDLDLVKDTSVSKVYSPYSCAKRHFIETRGRLQIHMSRQTPL